VPGGISGVIASLTGGATTTDGNADGRLRALFGDALALLGAVTAAGYYLIGRRVRKTLSLWPYVGLVYGVAFAGCVVLAVVTGGSLLPQPPRELAIFAGLALGPMLLGHTGMNWALGHLPAYVVNLTVLGEPVSAALLAGAGLIVAGGFALANERVRPQDFRRLGVLFAVGATVLFAVRDNVLRAIARDTSVDALVAAPVSLLAGTATVAVYLLITRREAWARGYGATARAFLPAGLLFGLSYTALFQAYYRGRVSVVAPLVATESLWGVAFSALLLRRTELVGRRLVAGAILIVAGGILIGASR